ncbi:DUF421 domain-containing protein [Chitiniphilus shinanonensis]|uniref:DUF421 domain-containing protein n=2 Tax=Chitiniphilus shinanonensis TaxID=553088 RepID=A0ABQ6BNN9_9NEIS|nr:YetF domain-containing protein [Chitiniphilus shinanonensis]GLS03072.1 DUF421 domain-containing protein [Chitiniphilus shinanonensis]
MDWDILWGLHQPIGETLLRGSFIYWMLFLIFRLILRRDSGSVNISDVLLVVILSEAIQQPMAGEIESLLEGLLLVGTLVFWNVLLDWFCYRFPALQRYLEPPPLLLIRDGRVIREGLRREMITLADLHSKLREQGIDDIAKVKRAYMEPNGNVSVIPKE